VRSPLYQAAAEPGPEAAQRAAAQNKVVRAMGAHDLKRIRGIGVLIEKKLHALGITAYEQIANWTADDIDRVSQSLDFKGRIERENWVEQARILSAGGHTEFSRRVDRGEVETSRVKTT
jgi:predicted flap endonuclease-1-like 5' DNA nuclease